MKSRKRYAFRIEVYNFLWIYADTQIPSANFLWYWNNGIIFLLKIDANSSKSPEMKSFYELSTWLSTALFTIQLIFLYDIFESLS